MIIKAGRIERLAGFFRSATWPSGKAEACKAFTPGSNPGVASITQPQPRASAPGCFRFHLDGALLPGSFVIAHGVYMLHYEVVSPGTTADSSRRGSIYQRRLPVSDLPKIDRAHIETWLSAPRYGKYLDSAKGNDEIAFNLYLWNTGLAQAVLKDVSFFEVALRNAYDRAISSAWSGEAHWLFDDSSPIRRPILRTNKRGQVNDANRLNRNSIDRLRSGLRGDTTADDVISNLTLGFWAHMTDRNHERDLWIPAVHKVWPKGTNRVDLNDRIAGINVVRNRAAHHEHLFSPEGDRCFTLSSCRDAVALFEQLEPTACCYVYGNSKRKSTVDKYLAENPAPLNVAV